MLTAMVTAVGLDGKNVILLVGEHSDVDHKRDAVREQLLKAREELGYSEDEMPIVFMDFESSDTEKQYFKRLGFKSSDAPVLCVAEWGNPARFGPKKVVGDAIARNAIPEHVNFIVQRYLKAEGKPFSPVVAPSPIASSPSTTPPNQGPGEIKIASSRFEASGKPNSLTNAGVRIQNVDNRTLHDLTIRFYSRISETDEWRPMGQKTLKKLPVGYFASREIVGDTRKYQLVDTQGNAIRCFYRIEIEHAGKVITEEGEFIPSEEPIGLVDSFSS